jgi:hypothetical protein
MRELKELKRAIWERLRELNLPVFDTAIPPGENPPFIRFYLIGMDWLSSFQGQHHFSRTGITVDAISKSNVSAEAENLFASVQEKLEGFIFETNTARYRMQLSSIRKVYDQEAGLWYVSGDFILHVSRKT